MAKLTTLIFSPAAQLFPVVATPPSATHAQVQHRATTQAVKRPDNQQEGTAIMLTATSTEPEAAISRESERRRSTETKSAESESHSATTENIPKSAETDLYVSRSRQ